MGEMAMFAKFLLGRLLSWSDAYVQLEDIEFDPHKLQNQAGMVLRWGGRDK